MPELTELQQTQIVYAYFTLDQWKLMAELAVMATWKISTTPQTCNDIKELLTKFPSSALTSI